MAEFESKRKNLFDILDSEEKKLKGTILEQKSYSDEDICSTNKLNKKRKLSNLYGSAEKLIGKESIFKKPDLPIQKCLKPRTVPDYQRNPHKWTKYSLEDADISDNANASAAFAFLQEMEKRKEIKEYKIEEADDDIHHKSESNDKVVFNKTAALKRSIRKKDNELEDVELQTPKFKSSAVVMPEYVVGQKPSKSKKEKRINQGNTNDGKSKSNKNEMKLSHLLEYDDGENEED